MFVVKSASCTLDSRRLSKRQEALKVFFFVFVFLNASQAFSLLFVQTKKASWKMRTIIMRPLANRKNITHYHTHTETGMCVVHWLEGGGCRYDVFGHFEGLWCQFWLEPDPVWLWAQPPQTFLQILKRWGFWWLLRGRVLEDTAGVAKTLDPLLPAQEWLSPRLEVAQQFGNLKKGTINDTSRRFTITEEESRTTAVAQSQITAWEKQHRCETSLSEEGGAWLELLVV